MTDNLEIHETLANLGLTQNQARVYIALIQSGPTTAKEISKLTKITRQDVYRIMPALQKEGIIEKTITAPFAYKAIPMKLAISILLKRKISEHNELKEKAKMLSTQFNSLEKTSFEIEPEFVLVPEKEAVLQRIRKATENVQTTLDIVSSKRRRPRAVLEFAEARMKALKRGAKIRVVSEDLDARNPEIENVLKLEGKAGVKTKFLSAPPPAVILIFDKKEVIIITSATGAVDSSALWSNNPSLLALAQSYFENMWQTAANQEN